MISITRLLCDAVGPGEHLRYENKNAPRPVVVWNCTRQCNLNCIHCYASADNRRVPGEMDTARYVADAGLEPTRLPATALRLSPTVSTNHQNKKLPRK